MSGNCFASRMKKIGKLFPTRSQLPSSVYHFTAKPRGSRSVSGDPFELITEEKRSRTGVSLPTSSKGSARVMSLRSAVAVKTPLAATPRACTTRSGMRSRSKAESFSMRSVSWSRTGPFGPAVCEFRLSPTGAPFLRVKVSADTPVAPRTSAADVASNTDLRPAFISLLLHVSEAGTGLLRSRRYSATLSQKMRNDYSDALQNSCKKVEVDAHRHDV